MGILRKPKMREDKSRLIITDADRVDLKGRMKRKAPTRHPTGYWQGRYQDYLSRINENIKREAKTYNWSPVKYLFVLDCKAAAEDENKKFGYLTVRKLWYRLLVDGIISISFPGCNVKNIACNLDGILTDARNQGLISWKIFEDRSRRTYPPDVEQMEDNSPTEYIKPYILGALSLPTLDPWENQKYYVEVWIEKDALMPLFNPIVVEERKLMLYPCKGQDSGVNIDEAIDRFKDKTENGRKGVILYAGDLDSSGWGIYESIQERIGPDIKVERYLMNPDQVQGLSTIPPKEKDSNFQHFFDLFPQLRYRDEEGKIQIKMYELDAMPTGQVRSLTNQAIDKYFDEDLVDQSAMGEWKKEFKSKVREIADALEPIVGEIETFEDDEDED